MLHSLVVTRKGGTSISLSTHLENDCFKIGITATEAFQLLQLAFGNDVMSRTQVLDWIRLFKDGRESVESDPRSGRPSTSRNIDKVEQVRQLVRSDRRLTVREIGEDVGISKTL